MNGFARWAAQAPTVCRDTLAHHKSTLLWGGLLGGLLLWVFAPTLQELVKTWERDAKYSHGYLVPVFALILARLRYPRWRDQQFQGSSWGVVVLVLGLVCRLVGKFLYLSWIEQASLVPCVAGVVVLLWGWSAFRVAWPSLVFLLFMNPLPYRVEIALAHPLQRLATIGSTYALQTLGFAAHADGNVILFGSVKLEVIEACNGLSMLMIFFAVSTAVAIIVRRPWLDRLLVLLSAVPIALICNITRITVTGVLHAKVSRELAHTVFHDLAGWLMMVLALGLLWLELRVVDWILPPKSPPMSGPQRLKEAMTRSAGVPSAVAVPR